MLIKRTQKLSSPLCLGANKGIFNLIEVNKFLFRSMNFVVKNIDVIATRLCKNLLVGLKIISNNLIVLSNAAVTISLYDISSNADKNYTKIFLGHYA